jgi:hypothetical protein
MMPTQEQARAVDPAAVAELVGALVRDRAVEPVDRVFLARGIRGLVSLVSSMESGAVEKAVAEATDLGVLLSAMESKSGLRLIARGGPLAAARLRGLQAKIDLLERAGGTLQPRQVAALLRMSRQAVGKRRAAGTLLGVPTGSRGYEYPACQFADGGVDEGLAEVLSAFDVDVGPWMRLAFLVTASDALGGEPPMDVLRRGEVDAVARAARIHGEHGAA